MGVAHLALDLGPGSQGGHRVDDHHVKRPGADEHVSDLESLLAGVGLGDQKFVHIDADGSSVGRVHGVLGVDVGTDASVALGFGHHMGGQRGLTRALRPVDLDHPAPRNAADAEGQIESQRPGGHRLDRHGALVAHLHDGTGAELLLDLT